MQVCQPYPFARWVNPWVKRGGGQVGKDEGETCAPGLGGGNILWGIGWAR